MKYNEKENINGKIGSELNFKENQDVSTATGTDNKNNHREQEINNSRERLQMDNEREDMTEDGSGTDLNEFNEKYAKTEDQENKNYSNEINFGRQETLYDENDVKNEKYNEKEGQEIGHNKNESNEISFGVPETMYGVNNAKYKNTESQVMKYNEKERQEIEKNNTESSEINSSEWNDEMFDNKNNAENYDIPEIDITTINENYTFSEIANNESNNQNHSAELCTDNRICTESNKEHSDKQPKEITADIDTLNDSQTVTTEQYSRKIIRGSKKNYSKKCLKEDRAYAYIPIITCMNYTEETKIPLPKRAKRNVIDGEDKKKRERRINIFLKTRVGEGDSFKFENTPTDIYRNFQNPQHIEKNKLVEELISKMISAEIKCQAKLSNGQSSMSYNRRDKIGFILKLTDFWHQAILCGFTKWNYTGANANAGANRNAEPNANPDPNANADTTRYTNNGQNILNEFFHYAINKFISCSVVDDAAKASSSSYIQSIIL